MKTLIQTAFFLLLSHTTLSQENYFAIGAFTSLDKYNYHFKENHFHLVDSDTDLASMTGLKFQYCIMNKWSIGLGAAFSQKSYTGFMEWQPFPGSLNTESVIVESHLVLKYISIPISLKRYFYDNDKIKLSGSAQLNSEFLMDWRETLINVEKPERRFHHLHQYVKNVHFSSQINLGIEYHPNKRLFLTVEPNYRVGLKHIDKELMERKPSSFGVELSANFKI